VGGVALAGGIAGCLGGSDGGTDGTNGGADDGSGAPSVDEWLSDADNYDSVVDATGRESVTVEVGARGNNGSNAFAPAAIEVSPGTTVTWEWVDGYHNVVARDGRFSSGHPEQNATFEYTFEKSATTLYYCEPHRSMGMKGAVIVADGGGDGSGDGDGSA
jgi:halocyanin-like protein